MENCEQKSKRATDEIVREALALFRDRQMSKAVSLLTGAAQVDATDPLVREDPNQRQAK